MFPIRSEARVAARFGLISVMGLSLAGCLPGEAAPVPALAIRADGGVLTVLLPPMCPDWRVESAEVSPMSDVSFPPPAWTGEGFVGESQTVVTLDQHAWTRVSGSYDQLTSFSAAVETTGVTFSVDVPDLTTITGLPEGKFANGPDRLTTVAEYETSTAETLDCDHS